MIIPRKDFHDGIRDPRVSDETTLIVEKWANVFRQSPYISI